MNMGVLPLQFKAGESVASLGFTGREVFEIGGIASGVKPRGELTVRARRADGKTTSFAATVRIDTPEELVSFSHGGILPYVLRRLLAA